MKLGMAFTAILLATGILPASAYPRHHHHYQHYAHRHLNPVAESLGMGLAVMLERQNDWPAQPAPVPFGKAVRSMVSTVGQILPHPSGCPSRAFCGCGAASYLGISNRDLWLAANWFRFPRAAPGPGMAAVRRHHVMVIVSYEGGDVATVYDANSGRHMTRIHQVSLRGYEVVDPRGHRYARL